MRQTSTLPSHRQATETERISDSPRSRSLQESPGSSLLSPEEQCPLDLEKSIVILTIDLGVKVVEKVIIEQCLQQLHLVENKRGTP